MLLEHVFDVYLIKSNELLNFVYKFSFSLILYLYLYKILDSINFISKDNHQTSSSYSFINFILFNSAFIDYKNHRLIMLSYIV